MATVSILNLLTGSSTPLLASGDVVPFVDISDSTQSPGGSTVKATLTQFFAAIPVPIIVTNTGTQLQLKYDGSNHVTVAVSSAGAVTLNATGASAGFTFSDAVTVNAVVSVAVAAGTPIAADFTGAAAVNPLYRGKRGGTDRWFIGVDASDQFAVLDATGTTANLTITDAGAGTFRAGITATTGTFSETGTAIASSGDMTFANTKAAKFKNASNANYSVIRNGGDNVLNFVAAAGANGMTLFSDDTLNIFGGLQAGFAGIGGVWELGSAAVVSPTSPNRTLSVKIGGTTYYIHAKTTND